MALTISSVSVTYHTNLRCLFHPVLFSSPAVVILPVRSRKPTQIRAKLGGGDAETKDPEKKFITKEEEPEQYWTTAGEREGENPMKTPLPYIAILGLLTPFIILGIAFANGWIKGAIIR
ncbi:hypothetical protein ZOSMA_1G03890 [Zostera marina]|uniref:Uncharacterized protein n=1 Tax=Zostera marina TaxID=29655 RepID=A0A0K9PN46_ZOSMR|nr:hypothetical protein ZOSMA_1G03890 [Zostera marina]